MDLKFWKTVLRNLTPSKNYFPITLVGRMRFKASGEFTYFNDTNLLAAAGKFQFILLVPAGITAVLTLTEYVNSFTASPQTYAFTVPNAGAVDIYQVIETEGQFQKAVLTGAGASMQCHFVGEVVNIKP